MEDNTKQFKVESNLGDGELIIWDVIRVGQKIRGNGLMAEFR